MTESIQKNEAHAINVGIEQKIDSLTDFTFNSKIKVLSNRSASIDETDFIRNDNVKTRNTSINTTSKGDGYDISNNLKLSKRFKKKDRLLLLSYGNTISENNSDGILKTLN